jgi:DNA-binding NarL/FixJ family response regulator
VIVLTMFQADEQAIARYAPSASGFLVKDLRLPRSSTLYARLPQAMPSSRRPTPELCSRTSATSKRPSAAAQQRDVLTERNRDVAAVIGSGASNAEVAAGPYA